MAPSKMKPRSRQIAFWSVISAALIFASLQIGLACHLEFGPPRGRDPEYHKRLSAVRKQLRQNPDARLVLVLGSSRTSMGVAPGQVHQPPVRGPMMVNFSLVGSGPIMQLLAWRRAKADGLKPAAVLLEFWPAFLREDGPYHEDARMDPTRLNQADWPIIERYFRPEHLANVQAQWRQRRIAPWYAHRKSLMNQIAHPWLPFHQRTEAIWERIDHWGWLPGRESVTPQQADEAIRGAANYYVPLFQQFQIGEVADAALRELVAECRGAGVPLAMYYLPESRAFTEFMPTEAKLRAEQYLKSITNELKIPFIDCRGSVDDAQLPDGFHLMQPGAGEVTRRLFQALEMTFPELRVDKP